MNQVVLIGNVTRDPVMTQVKQVNLAEFTLAVQRNYKNAKGEYDTDFFRCKCWRALADLVHQYVTKGSKLAIVGHLTTETYTVKEETRTAVTVHVENVDFLSKKTVTPHDDEVGF